MDAMTVVVLLLRFGVTLRRCIEGTGLRNKTSKLIPVDLMKILEWCRTKHCPNEAKTKTDDAKIF